jgi:CRP/FNR family nitrogen fixation transcriptional regulator
MSGHTQAIAARLQAGRWQPPLAPQSLPSSPTGLDLLEDIGSVLPVHRDQEIYGQDAPAEYYYQVISGSVRTVKLMADGRRQVSEFLLPGELFGFDALERHDFAAEALEDSLVKRYPRRGVEALAERSMPLSHKLRHLTSAKLRQAQERMLLLGRMTSSERIACFLLQMSDRAPASAKGRIELAMSRRDIADYLGLTIETVSRTLTMLRLDGTIRMFKKSKIEIRDRAALESLASEPRH